MNSISPETVGSLAWLLTSRAHEWRRDGPVRLIEGYFRLLSDGLSMPRFAVSLFLRRTHASRPQVGRQGSRNHAIGEEPGSRVRVRWWFLEVVRVDLGAGRGRPGAWGQTDRRFAIRSQFPTFSFLSERLEAPFGPGRNPGRRTGGSG